MFMNLYEPKECPFHPSWEKMFTPYGSVKLVTMVTVLQSLHKLAVADAVMASYFFRYLLVFLKQRLCVNIIASVLCVHAQFR